MKFLKEIFEDKVAQIVESDDTVILWIGIEFPFVPQDFESIFLLVQFLVQQPLVTVWVHNIVEIFHHFLGHLIFYSHLEEHIIQDYLGIGTKYLVLGLAKTGRYQWNSIGTLRIFRQFDHYMIGKFEVYHGGLWGGVEEFLKLFVVDRRLFFIWDLHFFEIQGLLFGFWIWVWSDIEVSHEFGDEMESRSVVSQLPHGENVVLDILMYYEVVTISSQEPDWNIVPQVLIWDLVPEVAKVWEDFVLENGICDVGGVPQRLLHIGKDILLRCP